MKGLDTKSKRVSKIRYHIETLCRCSFPYLPTKPSEYMLSAFGGRRNTPIVRQIGSAVPYGLPGDRFVGLYELVKLLGKAPVQSPHFELTAAILPIRNGSSGVCTHGSSLESSSEGLKLSSVSKSTKVGPLLVSPLKHLTQSRYCSLAAPGGNEHKSETILPSGNSHLRL